MKNIVLIVLAICLLTSCSKDSNEEAVEINTFDTILGRWEQSSYLSSGGYFISQKDGSYYEFKKDKTFLKYTGTILNETKTGSFEYNPQSKSIRCDLGRVGMKLLKLHSLIQIMLNFVFNQIQVFQQLK